MRPEAVDMAGGKAGQAIIFIAGLVLASFLPKRLQVWPIPLLLPLLLLGVALLISSRLRASVGWWSPGRWSGPLLLATASIIIVSSAALISFQVLFQPDVSGLLAVLPTAVVHGLGPLALAFCILNAVLEELAFRGVLLDALEARWGPVAAITGSSLAFGFAHYAGYPSGAAGVAMATAYSLALGMLRRASRGLLLPIAAHTCADVTIVLILSRTATA